MYLVSFSVVIVPRTLKEGLNASCSFCLFLPWQSNFSYSFNKYKVARCEFYLKTWGSSYFTIAIAYFSPFKSRHMHFPLPVPFSELCLLLRCRLPLINMNLLQDCTMEKKVCVVCVIIEKTSKQVYSVVPFVVFPVPLYSIHTLYLVGTVRCTSLWIRGAVVSANVSNFSLIF